MLPDIRHLAIIKSLDPNKSHVWDVSIKMIKLFEELLAPPLQMIFEAVLNDGAFPDDWKKGNIIPAHKISLLTICAIFKMIIFTSMFEYFLENELFTVFQSGFLPGHS